MLTWALEYYVRQHVRATVPIPATSTFSNGDTTLSYCIEWDSPHLTKSIEHAAADFEAQFLSEYRLGSFPHLPQPEPGQVAQCFMSYLVYLKRRHYLHPKNQEEIKRRARSRDRRQQVSHFQHVSLGLTHLRSSDAELIIQSCMTYLLG
jgi:hypothetical protein